MACHHRPCAAHGRELDAIIALRQHIRTHHPRCQVSTLSSSLCSTHGRTISGIRCHHFPWAAHTVGQHRKAYTVGQRQALHAIIVLGERKRSNDFGHDMLLSPLDSTYDQTKSGVEAHTVGQCLAWHANIDLGKDTRSNDVRRDMLSLPLDNTYDRMTSGVVCTHVAWKHTRSDNIACNAIITLSQHTQSYDIEHDVPSSFLGSTHAEIRSSVACYHRLGKHLRSDYGQLTRTNDIGRGMPAWALRQHKRSEYVGHDKPSLPLRSAHGRMTLGLACLQGPWEAHMVERCRASHGTNALGQQAHTVGQRQAWHSIIGLGNHTRLNYVGRDMLSSPLGSTHRKTMSGVACHHCNEEAYTVGRRQAMHVIIFLGKHTRSNDIGSDTLLSPLDSTYDRTTSGVHTWSYDVGHDVSSSLLGRTQTPMTSSVACHNFPQAEHIIVDIGCGMPSSPLSSTHGRTTSGDTSQDDFRRGMPSVPLGSKHGQTTSGVACHHRPWKANTVERRQA
ncbi:hypothetical protein EJD97_002523 [Solanum chilense]|uniref:Uncharacterized protein n=1 Tax=Solanum chilense TaxID=4083 RepID=A0A6N2AL53_SOLCI|nr:hypothetical protein EJD97_002523 [Solanum chilense]